MPGITMSVITMSGRSFSASLNAASPSLTHETTFMPMPSQLIMESMPMRTSNSSSDISTFIIESVASAEKRIVVRLR